MQDWNYLRGGLTTLDRDYGIFNKIHHDIGTHVLHHLFPQVCHFSQSFMGLAVHPVLQAVRPTRVHALDRAVSGYESAQVGAAGTPAVG